MNRHKRPSEAVLPTATRPQLVHIGRRRRIEHLSKNARVAEGTTPCGLPNETRERDICKGPGSSAKGLAYRNSVFQVLLNTPMFVNFVRMHATRWHPSHNCPMHPSCLTCAMANLALRYWQESHNSEAGRIQSVELGCKMLWDLCRKTFWPKSTPLGRIGPLDPEDEFYADSFLLNFLKEMRSQLERSPSEYQTFEKMFAVHTVCKWKCNSKSCGWISAPFKWESSLHLSLSVQRPHVKSRQTPILIGIERALRTKLRLTARRASTPHQEKCEKCQKPIESFTDIVSLPEVLIVVRDLEELLPGDEPDIPLREELNLSGLASGPDNFLDPKKYELISAVAENRYSPLVSRNCAFARAAKDPENKKWFCIMDEAIRETDLSTLDKLQRSIVDDGLADVKNICPICPEIFIYRLKDYDTRSELIDSFGAISPFNDTTKVRNAIARSVSDIFTQKIGRGLLKFKIKLAPIDPSDQDKQIIEVDLKLSYEIDGKHYGVVNKEGNFLAFQLKPLQQTDRDDFEAIWTPYEGRAIHRAVRRLHGVYPENEEEAKQQLASEFVAQMNIPAPNGFTTQTGQNPFVPSTADDMDIDVPPGPNGGKGGKGGKGRGNGQGGPNKPGARGGPGYNQGGNRNGQNGRVNKPNQRGQHNQNGFNNGGRDRGRNHGGNQGGYRRRGRRN